MLRTIIAKGDPPINSPAHHEAATPPTSTPTLSGGELPDSTSAVDPCYNTGIKFATSTSALDDTVDGMGVITFADEVTSGFFGTGSPNSVSKFILTILGPTSNSGFFSYISHALTVQRHFHVHRRQARDSNVTDTSYISRPPSPGSSAEQPHRHPEKQDPVDYYSLPPEVKVIELVDLFFKGPGLLFPYIYKKDVIDSLSHMKNTNFHGVRRSWLCLLNTIMAVATCVRPNPSERKENWAAEGNTFLQRALGLLPNIALKPANIETRKYWTKFPSHCDAI